MLDDLKLIHERDAHDTLGHAERQWRQHASEELLRALTEWSAVAPTKKNLAKQIALEVIGKTPVMYSGSILAPAANHWRRGFQLHAKHLCWTVVYSEDIEAELTGWTKQPIHKPYTIIDLESSLEHADVQAAFALAERQLSGKRPAPITVAVQGANEPEQLAWASALGDYVTIYTAILTGSNPSSRPFSDRIVVNN